MAMVSALCFPQLAHEVIRVRISGTSLLTYRLCLLVDRGRRIAALAST